MPQSGADGEPSEAWVLWDLLRMAPKLTVLLVRSQIPVSLFSLCAGPKAGAGRRPGSLCPFPGEVGRRDGDKLKKSQNSLGRAI